MLRTGSTRSANACNAPPPHTFLRAVDSRFGSLSSACRKCPCAKAPCERLRFVSENPCTRHKSNHRVPRCMIYRQLCKSGVANSTSRTLIFMFVFPMNTPLTSSTPTSEVGKPVAFLAETGRFPRLRRPSRASRSEGPLASWSSCSSQRPRLELGM